MTWRAQQTRRKQGEREGEKSFPNLPDGTEHSGEVGDWELDAPKRLWMGPVKKARDMWTQA